MKYIAWLALSLPLVGCLDPSADQEEALKRTESQLVARINVAPSHAVEFYEIQPGVVAIYEHGSLDNGDKPVDLSALENKSVAELYEQLSPGKPVPERVRQAELRQRAYKESLANPSQESLVPMAAPVAAVKPPLRPPPLAYVVAEPTRPAPQPEGRSEGLAGSAPGAGEVAQLDAASDAVWWQSNFCTWANGVDGVWCPTNVAWAHSGARPTMYYEATGFSASSIASANVWVDQYTNAWVNVFSANAGPRSWWRWTSTAEATYRSGVDGQQPEPWVHFAERYRAAITTFSSNAFFPTGTEWGFTNDIQGMKHDASNWYFTRTDYGISSPNYGQVAKTPVSTSLNNDPLVVYSEPSEMLNAGFKHFGDLAIRGSLLYIAMDGGGRCAIAVWQSNIAYYQGWAVVPGLSGCGWVAYNPRDNLFYFNDGNNTLRKYSITVNGSSVSIQEFLPKVTLSADLTSMQGADFSSRGVLYVSRGYKENPMTVYAVDVNSGFVYQRAGWTTGNPGDWEAEGLTLWDLTGGQAPGITGHLHVQLLDNDLLDDDNLWIAHLTATDPSRL